MTYSPVLRVMRAADSTSSSDTEENKLTPAFMSGLGSSSNSNSRQQLSLVIGNMLKHATPQSLLKQKTRDNGQVEWTSNFLNN